MEVEVEWLRDAAFAANARGHRVVSDQPADKGGGDTGMTPPELLLASLGTCVGHYVVEFCKARAIPHEEVRIKVSAETLRDPGRVGNIAVAVRLPVELEPGRLRALVRAATHCTIHNTLGSAPEIHVQVCTPATEPCA